VILALERGGGGVVRKTSGDAFFEKVKFLNDFDTRIVYQLILNQ
jgi:hypothetical protein